MQKQWCGGNNSFQIVSRFDAKPLKTWKYNGNILAGFTPPGRSVFMGERPLSAPGAGMGGLHAAHLRPWFEGFARPGHIGCLREFGIGDTRCAPSRWFLPATPVSLQRRHPFRWDYGQEAFLPPVVFLCASQARPALFQARGKPFSAGPFDRACVSNTDRRHRPRLAGNALRCIRWRDERSVARVDRAGICGEDEIRPPAEAQEYIYLK